MWWLKLDPHQSLIFNYVFYKISIFNLVRNCAHGPWLNLSNGLAYPKQMRGVVLVPFKSRVFTDVIDPSKSKVL